MTSRENFTEEEWSRVVGAPMLAGIAVTAADPGGLWGAIKESTAVAGSITDKNAPGGLVGEIIAEFQTSEGRTMAKNALHSEVKGKKPEEIVEAALLELAAISTLVAQKTPDEIEAFRAWINELANNVAEAGTEGGFLGFGGVKVSDAEKATLDRLASALA
ncbi:hypothetical protein [Amaricoccus tamworthensis]|uniref:hypothetical protein n=1 Tax=Amaricoccus tamworthensis TaxID=57002 RepID=UPI003C7D2008